MEEGLGSGSSRTEAQYQRIVHGLVSFARIHSLPERAARQARLRNLLHLKWGIFVYSLNTLFLNLAKLQ